MNDTKLTTLDQVRAFLSGTAEVAFTPAADDAARYADIARVLRRFGYPRLKRGDKGLLLRYLRSTSGYSRQQLTRLIAQFVATGTIQQHYGAPLAGFARKYADADVRLLADMDALHSVHQGDLDGVKGLYYINAVDCVTQWELVASCEKLSEAFLLPVIEQLLNGFPFVLHGFHADNGPEYVSHQVAAMLNKLNLEFTRSRPRTSNDNGLAETKNGVIIRKQFGYAHIPQHYAGAVNAVCAEHLNPYLNF